MYLELTEDQAFFQETTRKFLQAEVPLTVVRELYESPQGYDGSWWGQAAELGWTGLFVPEEHGGGSLSGGSARDAVIVAEEMGRLVSPGPFLPVNLVAAVLGWYGSQEQQAEVLPALLGGEAVASWASCEPGRRWDGDAIATTATIEGDEVVLQGTKAYVEAAAVARWCIVTARGAGGLSMVLVPADAAGVTVRPGRSIDMTRRFGTVVLDGVRLPRSAVIGDAGQAAPGIDRALQLAVALQCAELVGIADRTLEFTLQYGHDRFAFGRPIVSFQALKHRIADMAVWLEGSKAVSDALAKAVDEQAPDVARLASVAKAYVGQHALDIVDDCVQITGGIGVTWEHDIHLYNRRCAVDRALFGSPEEHKERIVALLEG